MSRRIATVVLAAGMSRRMGQPKQLLPFGGSTVLRTVLKMLQSVSGRGDVVVVLGHRADEVRKVLPAEVRYVINEAYAEGMFSSVLAGLASLDEDVEGMLLLLGDQPQIRASVVQAVLDRWEQTDKGIVIPEVGGKRGHPILVDVRRYGEAIRSLDGSEGMKPIVRGYPEDTAVVILGDESILRDLDTPEDYELEIKLRNDA